MVAMSNDANGPTYRGSNICTRLSSIDEPSWRKVLYDKQGVADNYVPKTFLKDLKKNGLDN